MDLNLFFAVLWRSKWTLLAGVLAGAVLALLAYGTPGFSGGKPSIKPRSAEVWQSESQLLIAQAGFPYRQAAEVGEPARQMGSLSPVYAGLANGNIVQDQIRSQLGPEGTVKASEDIDLAASSFLPFVDFTATAPSPQRAARLAHGAAVIFQNFVAHQQAASGVPVSRRIQLEIVESGANPKLSEGHKITIPVLVLMAFLVGTVSLIFVKENLRTAAEAKRALAPLEHADAVSGIDPLESAVAGPAGGQMGTNGVHDHEADLHRDPVMSSNA